MIAKVFLLRKTNVLPIMSTNTNPDDAKKSDFVSNAVALGIREQVALLGYEIFAPWALNRALSGATRLYEDLGIVDEDLEDVAFELWRKVFNRAITESEASEFPLVKTVADLLLHISSKMEGKTEGSHLNI